MPAATKPKLYNPYSLMPSWWMRAIVHNSPAPLVPYANTIDISVFMERPVAAFCVDSSVPFGRRRQHLRPNRCEGLGGGIPGTGLSGLLRIFAELGQLRFVVEQLLDRGRQFGCDGVRIGVVGRHHDRSGLLIELAQRPACAAHHRPSLC